MTRLAIVLAVSAFACGNAPHEAPELETAWVLERAELDPSRSFLVRAELPACATSVDAVASEGELYSPDVALSIETSDMPGNIVLAVKRGDELLQAPGLVVPPGGAFAVVTATGAPLVVSAWAVVQRGCTRD